MIFDNHYHHYHDTEPESHILHLKATKSAIISQIILKICLDISGW